MILLQNLEDTQNELQLKETRIKNLVTENQDLRDSIQKVRCDIIHNGILTVIDLTVMCL